MNINKIKADIIKNIDARSSHLGELSRKIHDNPETAMQERRAAVWLMEFLKENGFTVVKGISGMPTAFRAVYGKGKPVIAFLAEYDALPKLGHACGHNLIAASAVAAGVAAKLAADKFGGSIIVYGTPAEEADAGKAIMAEKGAFDGLDAVMITHPGGGNRVVINALACQTLEVEFFGRAAHAAADPEAGINALEAMILSYNAIDALRQHIKEKARIHGIITDGGEAPNIVPAHTAATFLVRATDDEYLDILKEKVISCFAGAAAATGAELKYRWAKVRYAPMLNNRALAKLFRKNMQSLGRSIPIGDADRWSGSSDVGNVSQIVPTIQPMVAIAPHDVLIHSSRFAEVAATDAALYIMLDAARAMAMTAADLLASPETLAGVRAEFQKSKKISSSPFRKAGSP
ncbi:MAG: peptidase M20 [Chloroflexi bacterium RBG_16_50_11]|nr:MAG: peptidase M20 [Chloroflexi bacterium RBG_16_50_11]